MYSHHVCIWCFDISVYGMKQYKTVADRMGHDSNKLPCSGLNTHFRLGLGDLATPTRRNGHESHSMV